MATLAVAIALAVQLPALAATTNVAAEAAAGDRLELSLSALEPATDQADDGVLAVIEDRRHHQLQLHQGLALGTLGTMALAAGMGLWSAHGYLDRSAGTAIHAALGGISAGLYLASAGLSLSAPALPPDPGSVAAGWDTVDVHRALAWGHGAAMALTVLTGVARLSGRLDNEPHQAAGLAAVALMGFSAGVIALVP